MSKPVASTELVLFSPPLNLFELNLNSAEINALKDLKKRVGEAYQRGLNIEDLLKTYPKLVAHSFDLAMEIEKEGNKPLATEIRSRTANAMLVSSPSPDIHDTHFLTPPLTGKYPVGVKSYYLNDTSRMEKDLGHNIEGTRRLLIDVHYPAVQSKTVFYKAHQGNPTEWTRSQPGLKPIFNEQFPLVIFSPGYGCSHDDYQHIVEDLASHGFCVITVSHPFTSNNVSYLGRFQNLHIAGEELTEKFERELATRAGDVEFVIDQIKREQNGDFRDLSVNLDLIGVMGHSVGGATALQTCLRNPELIKAGINVDGRILPGAKIKHPFLTMHRKNMGTEKTDLEVREEWNAFHDISPCSTMAPIADATHMDFSLMPVYEAVDKAGSSPVEAATIKGKHSKVTNLVNPMIVSFFSQCLKNERSKYKEKPTWTDENTELAVNEVIKPASRLPSNVMQLISDYLE